MIIRTKTAYREFTATVTPAKGGTQTVTVRAKSPLAALDQLQRLGYTNINVHA